jgi:hypothetical protein
MAGRLKKLCEVEEDEDYDPAEEKDKVSNNL